MNNLRSKKSVWIIIHCICILLACCVLCSCSGLASCSEELPYLKDIYAPRLELYGNDYCQTPCITGSYSASQNTKELAEHFSPVIDIINSANSQKACLRIDYSFEKNSEGKGYRLSSSIVPLSGSGSIALADIIVPYAGSIKVLGVMPDISMLSDGPFALIYINLRSIGFDLEPYRMSDENLTQAEVSSLLIDYYEIMSGGEVDISKFQRDDSPGELFLKSLELNLCRDDSSEFSKNVAIKSNDFAYCAAGLITAVYNDICGKGSIPFEKDELIWAFDTILDTYFSDHYGWDDFSNRLKGCVAGSELEGEISRGMLAYVFVKAYEDAFGEISGSEYSHYSHYLDDTDSRNPVIAVNTGIMPAFPSATVFCADYTPRYCQLPSMIYSMLDVCVDRYSNDFYANTQQTLGYLDVLGFITSVHIHALELGIRDRLEMKTVVNDRDYDWYVAQYNTGEYSFVNCMPTIASMAALWYDRSTDITAEKLREKFLPKYDEGWYMWQVSECLEDSGIPNKNATLDESMTDYIDSGYIILSQMSEASPSVSGHCFVIYGYRKLGDTLQFYINDPGVYDGVDMYGKPPGKAMVLDSGYAEYIISRMTYYYIVVGTEG